MTNVDKRQDMNRTTPTTMLESLSKPEMGAFSDAEGTLLLFAILFKGLDCPR